MRAAPSHHKTIASVEMALRVGIGFCEGEHGSFAYGFGTCVICGVRKDYRTPRETKRSRRICPLRHHRGIGWWRFP